MKISEQKGKIPTRDRSFDDRGGEGPSVVKVATSFPARLLGAIGELKKCLNEEERRRRNLEFSENSKGSGSFSFSLIGFFRRMIA